MKRQLFTAALLGASMFTAPLMLNQSAAATRIQTIQLKDMEPNNLKPNMQALGAISPKNFLQIKGSVSRFDKTDVQYFPVLPGTKLFSFTLNARGASWGLYEDTNKNFQVDRADKLVLFNKNGSVQTSSGKRYLLRVNKSATSSSGSYSGSVYTQAVRRSVTVKVHSAKAISRFDAKIRFTKKDRADFFAELYRGNAKFPVSRTNKVNDNNSPTFSKVMSDSIAFDAKSLRYRIQLMDADAGFDDEANISPASSKSLFITYLPEKRQVLGPNGKVIGRSGQRITMQGNSGKRASITFSVNHIDR
ncbi:hypothetical protein IQ266_04450 [filamentous cyanobacterium LEGE 11480]|uniref:Uncharacterized protein n=1 Tax=Romeriopsis navalis LEGE 11480 TaxID=2777977 RepID=A0A928Z2G1_9CYAN|nr:C2 domain-containing protein [Romeriopsis navalis]MBE9029012.1 hypothetical protein [Romeriopsis navalis LEGE 11480]